MLRLLHEPGDRFAVLTYMDRKTNKYPRTAWFQMSADVSDLLAGFLLKENGRERRGAALSVCAFDDKQTRGARNAIATSAAAEPGVATGLVGCHFHRNHRYPGTHPV